MTIPHPERGDVFKLGPTITMPSIWFDECLRCDQPIEGKAWVFIGGAVHYGECPEKEQA